MLVILCACMCVFVFGGGREIKKEKEKETSYFPSIFCLSPLADNGLSVDHKAQEERQFIVKTTNFLEDAVCMLAARCIKILS